MEVAITLKGKHDRGYALQHIQLQRRLVVLEIVHALKGFLDHDFAGGLRRERGFQASVWGEFALAFNNAPNDRWFAYRPFRVESHLVKIAPTVCE